jgi:hypothetical protein
MSAYDQYKISAVSMPEFLHVKEDSIQLEKFACELTSV